MILKNSYAYNADSNIWSIFHSRGIYMSKPPDYKIENDVLFLYYFDLESDYSDEQFFGVVYFAINNVENYYRYKSNGCYMKGKRDGDKRRYKYDIEIQFKF